MKRNIKISFARLVLIIGLIMFPTISCDNQAPVIPDDNQETVLRRPDLPSAIHGDNNEKEMVFNDTLELGLNEYAYNSTYKLRLEYDSLVQDCRCPENVVCIWAGYASARFKLTINDNAPIPFVLGTVFGNQVGMSQDTIFDGFEFKLINCLPYPNTKKVPDKSEYKVLVTIKQTNQSK